MGCWDGSQHTQAGKQASWWAGPRKIAPPLVRHGVLGIYKCSQQLCGAFLIAARGLSHDTEAVQQSNQARPDLLSQVPKIADSLPSQWPDSWVNAQVFDMGDSSEHESVKTVHFCDSTSSCLTQAPIFVNDTFKMKIFIVHRHFSTVKEHWDNGLNTPFISYT